MKYLVKFTVYLLLLIAPFLLMIIVNESQRGKMQGLGYQKNGISAMHSLEKTPNYCTWYCHNDTDYCIKNHNKIIKGDFFVFTNQIYNKIISFLSSVKGGYQVMNIAFLVVGVPLMIWLLLIGSIDKYLKIKRLRE